ncbi:hypothetical protein V8E52_004213 [Russula decolorans]
MSSSMSSSFLLRITPEHTFDIHVLRTFTRDLNGWIVRLQPSSPNACETINQVIYALNHTFREVEASYREWRNERIQSVLQHGKKKILLPLIRGDNETDPSTRAGFHYARARIQAALWRRERGRPAATFPAIYPAFQFSGVINPSPERQSRSLPLTQVDTSLYQHNIHVPAGPSSAPWSPQPQSAQLYPVQNNAAQPPPVGSVTSYSPGFGHGHSPPHVDNPYPPPPYPPAHWRPPDPVPGSPPVPAAAAATVEVAIRYLEAVNKAINICVDFDAM